MNASQVEEWLESIKTNILNNLMSGDMETAKNWIRMLMAEIQEHEAGEDLPGSHNQEGA